MGNADIAGKSQRDNRNKVAQDNGEEDGLNAQAGEHIGGVGKHGQQYGHADPHQQEFKGGNMPVFFLCGKKLAAYKPRLGEAFQLLH